MTHHQTLQTTSQFNLLNLHTVTIDSHKKQLKTKLLVVLETKFKLPKTTIKHTFKEINTIAIQHIVSIILHQRKIENNQPLSIDY